jgi:hypothetical protein
MDLFTTVSDGFVLQLGEMDLLTNGSHGFVLRLS